MNHCLTCKVQLDQPGLVETADCGGDCLECMGRAGDPAAAEAFLKEIKALRATLVATLGSGSRVHTASEPSMDGAADPGLLQKARDAYQEYGTIEIDDNAQISVGDEGTWVQAWVYVPHEEGEDDERP